MASNSSSPTSTTPAAADEPTRGHVIRDGGKEHLALPPSAKGNVVVTDRTNLEVAPVGSFEVVDGRVVRRSGVWAAGRDRWLVEYDRNS